MFKKRKVWLREEEVVKMIEFAKASKRDYLLLSLMRWGLRCGEIVGEGRLPGIHVEDIRPRGIWIKGKGYGGLDLKRSKYDVTEREVPVPNWVITRLREATEGFKPTDKVFHITERQCERLVNAYAKKAGVADWKLVGPHRLRAFFATDMKNRGIDAFSIRDLMRHKNLQTTNIYIGQSTPERLSKIVETASETSMT